MSISDELKAQAHLELAQFEEAQRLSLSDRERRELVDCLDLAYAEDVDRLILLSQDEEHPQAIRYNLRATIGGAVGIIGGFQGTLIGALILLAGLWALSPSRRVLPRVQAAIVALLYSARARRLRVEQLRKDLLALDEFWAPQDSASAFVSVLTHLESLGVVSRESGWVELKESCTVDKFLS